MSKMMRNYVIGLSIAIVIYAAAVSWLTIRDIIVPAELINTMILFILASATIFYAIRTSDIAQATREQADASVKMAEAVDKPIVLPSVAFTPPSEMRASFKNIGKGPALHVEANICHPYFEYEGPLPKTVLEVGQGVELRLERTATESRSQNMFEVITKYQDIYGKWFRCRLTQDQHGQNHLEYKELQRKEND